VFEVLEVTESIRRAVAEAKTQVDILAVARTEGMRTLRDAAHVHALNGTTSLAEVIEETSL
jgi:type II secretory ATPase GspE/PulE/Tfp pilus assembly ATPase PilB-like protein